MQWQLAAGFLSAERLKDDILTYITICIVLYSETLIFLIILLLSQVQTLNYTWEWEFVSGLQYICEIEFCSLRAGSETHWGRDSAFLAGPRCEIWMEIFIITGQKGNKTVNYGR